MEISASELPVNTDSEVEKEYIKKLREVREQGAHFVPKSHEAKIFIKADYPIIPETSPLLGN